MKFIPSQVRNLPSGVSATAEVFSGLGYSAAGGTADITKNSIAANTTENDERLDWSGTSTMGLDVTEGLGRLSGREFENVALGAFEKEIRFPRTDTDRGKTGHPALGFVIHLMNAPALPLAVANSFYGVFSR